MEVQAKGVKVHCEITGTGEKRVVLLHGWGCDGKLMKPRFMEMKSFHHITREQAMFLLSNAVQSEIYIYDNDKDDQRAGGGI